MLKWKQIVQDYIIKYSDRIKKTTRPLHERFKIEHFTYHKIDAKGNYTVLVDRPDWAEHYVDEKFYLQDPYLRHPDVYKSGFCFVGNHGSEEYKTRIMKDGKEIFNLDFGLMLVEKKFDSVEFFGFCGNSQRSGLDQLYLSHPWIFKTFAAHFRKELKPILMQMEGEADSLLNLKGRDFLCEELIHPQSAHFLDFLKDLGKGEEIKKVMSLSPRELECVALLSEGFTAKETAAHLKLSPRTVESYLENVKNKLSCSTKQEILFLTKKYQALGLIP